MNAFQIKQAAILWGNGLTTLSIAASMMRKSPSLTEAVIYNHIDQIKCVSTQLETA